MFSFRLKKQTSKNVTDTTFNVSRSCLLHEIIVFHSGAILHKAEITFLSSVSILKSFAKHIDVVSF